MSNLNIEVSEDNTEEAVSLMKEAVARGLEAVGLLAEGYAKMLCPVDTGRLRNSITHTSDGEAAYIGTNVEYAAYVEYGTSKTSAQPFLEPAATQHSDEYKAIFEQFCRNA
jgi:HK97 gp10 family phage protein